MSAENPADTVIEQAAKVGAEAIYWTLEWEQLDDETRSDATEFARALHDAGLLADPADRATVARVRGLADRWERWGHDGVPIRPSTAAGYLRVALDGAGEQQ